MKDKFESAIMIIIKLLIISVFGIFGFIIWDDFIEIEIGSRVGTNKY